MTDDELLAKLAAAFATPASAQPPASGLRDLHRALDVRSAQPAPLRRPVQRLLPIAVVTAVAAACVAVVLVIATLPRIGRETVSQVTVTVTSPAFGEVTVQQRALERALADGDVADVATSAERLRIALRNMSPSELQPVRAEIEHLLARADALIDRRRGGNDDLSPLPQSLTSAPQPTSAAAVPPAPTGTAAQATSPAAPLPTAASPAAPSTTLHDGADDGGDDHSGPGGGGAVAPVVPDDDNSGPGGGGDSGDSGSSGGSSGSGSSGSG
jgi:uncharacterized membrane protein YgcG